jgi:DNA-binding MarR family transcriptional regulator
MPAKDQKIGSPKTIRALAFWHGVTSAALRQLPIDLSSRQTAVLLNVYLVQQPHTIKSLSEELGISKPAVCRAIDVLEGAKLLKRKQDKQDRRNVLIERTAKGSGFLNEFADIILYASREAA